LTAFAARDNPEVFDKGKEEIVKRVLAIAGLLVVLLVILLGGALVALVGVRPFLGPKARPLTDRNFESTPERLARGRYLAENLAGCLDCHSEHDWKSPQFPVTRAYVGGVFPLEGLPGRIVSANLTPDPETGIGNRSDDQLARAIREGIGHDGRALFPLMPYPFYRHLSDEDLACIIVYLRSLTPVRNPLPKTEIAFPAKYLIRNVPQPVEAPVPPPDAGAPEKRGRYLAGIAVCADCHTPQRNGQPIPELAYAGGFDLRGAWGRIASSNITPDPTGIPYYDEELFFQVMRTGHVRARKLHDLMPWSYYKNLTDEDLKAMFAYLKTLPPIAHRVDNSLPPTMCKLCRNEHGAGDQN
jgi:cytochrome c553